MAFDGPTPFDGDPVYNYLDTIEGMDAAVVCAALEGAFDFVLGEDGYSEIDETVWAWAAAEMVATALGNGATSPAPKPFQLAAESLSRTDGEGLRDKALRVLDVVADPERSEAADLWNESGEGTLNDHLSGLRARLST